MNANKFIVAFGAALAIAGTVTVDGNVSFHDAVLIVEAFLGSLGVYSVANAPKTGVSGLVDRGGNPVARDPGQGTVGLFCVVVVAVLVAVLLLRAL
jgi:hypothetical protein